MEIVTGSTGLAHVTPIDDAVRNSNFGYYNEKIVFDTFRAFEAVAITANEVRVYGGYGMNQGRLFKIEKADYDSVTIENGTQGLKRSDLIVARYSMDAQTGYEDISLAVIKGQSGNVYTDPSYTEGNINEGATTDDFPLYRVKLNGIVIEDVEPLFVATPDGGRLGIIEQRLDGKMLVDLEKTTRDYLDGSENVDLGIKGNLPVENGGTGANSAAGAMKKIVIDTAAADSNTMGDTTEFLTSESNAGFSTSLKKRTAVNIWNYILTKIKAFLGMGGTEIVSVAHGGTGKASITSGKILVGNGTSTPTEKGIATNLNNPSDDDIPTTKAVNDALSAGGYGDMLSSEWTQNGYLKDGKGGIGARGFETGDPSSAGGTAVATSGALYAVKTALAQSFQAGVDTIYNAFVAKNVTPTASTPQALATAVGTTYDKGVTDGKNNEFTITGRAITPTTTPASGYNGYIKTSHIKSITINAYSVASGTSYFGFWFCAANDSVIENHQSDIVAGRTYNVPSGTDHITFTYYNSRGNSYIDYTLTCRNTAYR